MNVYFLNAGRFGLDILDMAARSMPVSGLIGLADTRDGTASGYCNGASLCRRLGVAYTEVVDYSLKNDDDMRRVRALSIDLLFVVGWQRLAPAWILDHCRFGAVGFHGSPWGIAKGRGRSPQNWALLLGEKKLSYSMFRLTPGVDDGNILDTCEISYTAHDDIVSAQYKTAVAAAMMICRLVAERGWERSGIPQDETAARYLPQRRPEDGAIDWRRSADAIYDCIRALTRPYPGAFSAMGDAVLHIWRARPFGGAWPDAFAPGEIVHVFVGGDLLIGTGNGLLLVDEWTATPPSCAVRRGTVLESIDSSAQMRRIVERHRKKYPALTVADILTGFEGESLFENE